MRAPLARVCALVIGLGGNGAGCNGVLGIPAASLRGPADACAEPTGCDGKAPDPAGSGGSGPAVDSGTGGHGGNDAPNAGGSGGAAANGGNDAPNAGGTGGAAANGGNGAAGYGDDEIDSGMPDCDDACLACKPEDGSCPAGCTSADDNDCPRELGAACTTASQCLQGMCVDGVCCDSACTDACHSCNLVAATGTCSAESFDADVYNCGGCGAACSSAHVSAACSGGTCSGSCDMDFADCNKDLRTDGCEVDLRTRPEHCGACGNVCPYGVCAESSCVFDRWGLYSAGPSSERRSADAMMGMKLQIARAGTLVALGMQTVIGAGDQAVDMRFGLYADGGGVPQALIAQTGELTTVHGPTEGATTPTAIAAGEYWFFFIARAAPRIATETVNAQWATRDVPYGPLPSNAPGLALPNLARANVYAVTVP
jgi:hypothetical protein